MFVTERLRALAVRVRPTAASRTRLLPVLPAIGALLPNGGLRRGTVVRCAANANSPARGAACGPAPGALSLALAVAAGPCAAGSWCALVGVEDAGMLCAEGYGLDLGRLVVVRCPPGEWVIVAGTLIDGIDVVVAAPSPRTSPAAVRALAARARDRGAVLLVVGGHRAWPADLELSVTDPCWHGLSEGAGHLRARRVTVTARGRGAAVRPVQRELWLPTATGKVAAA